MAVKSIRRESIKIKRILHKEQGKFLEYPTQNSSPILILKLLGSPYTFIHHSKDGIDPITAKFSKASLIEAYEDRVLLCQKALVQINDKISVLMEGVKEIEKVGVDNYTSSVSEDTRVIDIICKLGTWGYLYGNFTQIDGVEVFNEGTMFNILTTNEFEEEFLII